MIDVVRLKLTYLLNFFNELSLLFQNHWSVVFGVAKVETFFELQTLSAKKNQNSYALVTLFRVIKHYINALK